MIEIRSGNYAYTRVGVRMPVPRGEAIPPFWVEDGTMEYRWDGPPPAWATPAERAAKRATVKAKVLPPPPYPITEDTTFGVAGVGGPNFNQAAPHTVLFSVAPGVRVVFRKGNFINCRLPETDPDDLGNIQNIQGSLVQSPDRTDRFVRVLAEDETTATFTKALEEEVRSGRWDQHRCLGRVKEAARARREDPKVAEADLAELVAANEAALRKFEGRA